MAVKISYTGAKHVKQNSQLVVTVTFTIRLYSTISDW